MRQAKIVSGLLIAAMVVAIGGDYFKDHLLNNTAEILGAEFGLQIIYWLYVGIKIGELPDDID
jgi:hypothetical protein